MTLTAWRDRLDPPSLERDVVRDLLADIKGEVELGPTTIDGDIDLGAISIPLQ